MRDERIDFYKGILMFGVIWEHVITAMVYKHDPVAIKTFFITYDMPFFMIMSGYFLNKSVLKYSLKKLVVNKITTILLPTILWGLIASRFHSITGFYFLWSIFLSSLIVIFVHKSIGNKFLRIMVYGVITIVLNVIDVYLWNMAYLFPFFWVGAIGGWGKSYKIKFMLPSFVMLLCFWKPTYTVWETGTCMLKNVNYPQTVRKPFDA